MGLHRRTQLIIAEAQVILADYHPMTLRQLFYRLVAKNIVPNTDPHYESVGKTMIKARKLGLIPFTWIEDRLRLPRGFQGYDNPEEYLRSKFNLRGYHREPWVGRTESKVELWTEKDALSSFFEPFVSEYYVTLNVARGYDSLSSIYNAAERYKGWDDVTILYFGDFDPSGEDMVRSLETRLTELGADNLTIIKCALTLDDIKRYNLPPQPVKKTDSRAKAHIKQYGNISVELDALPPAVLVARIRTELERHLDLDLFNREKTIEAVHESQFRKLEARLQKAIPRLIAQYQLDDN